MTEPKRRGRPPGSRNKAKVGIDAAIDLSVPASVESWTAGPRGTRLIVIFRAALSTPGDQVEIDWPSGWAIPQLNDTIRISDTLAGRVQYVEYDVGNGVIKVTTA